MARGRYLSLEEARKMKHGLKRFAREHPSTGDEDEFDAGLQRMIENKPLERKKVKAARKPATKPRT